MLKKYDYNVALKMVDYMQDCTLATLVIEEDPDNKGQFLMEYTLKDEYEDTDKYDAIEKNYAGNLSKRITALDLLNEFIEMQALDRVNVFSMRYDMTTDSGVRCSTARSYSGEKLTPDSSADDVEKTIQRLEQELLNTGSQDMLVNAYTCKPSGKTKKYIQMKLIDLVGIIRENLR